MVPAHPVVTVFLEHEGKILLLKRSDRVRTFQGYWAGVSGSIERKESPRTCALREIGEETGLTDEEIVFLRRGRPLRVEADTRAWLVHPFLVHVASPEKIRLDWEHQQMRWILPDRLREYPTVPRLIETLERVWPLPPLDTRLRQLEADRTHGASELASLAVEHLLEASVVLRELPPAIRWERLLDFGWLLAQARPSMAAPANAVAEALWHLDRRLSDSHTTHDWEEVLSEIARDYRQRVQASRARMIAHARQQIRANQTILTHSYSSSVLDVLRDAGIPGLRVIVSESRPLMEGVELARRLSAVCPVILITDAQMGHFMKQANVALVGVDLLLPDGRFLNKVGTSLLALAAREEGVPFYALAQQEKCWIPLPGDPEPPLLEEKSPTEVLDEPLDNVTVRNVYFEPTPPALVRAFVTEFGLLLPTQVASLFEGPRTYFNIFRAG